LAQAAIEALEKLPKIDGCPWLIPNPETGKPFVTIKHSWQKARKDAGLQGLRLHDLRHTAASQMANSGVPLFTISILLGHSDLKSSSRYSHLADSTLMAAAEAGASRMSSQWAD
jgi:integrase